MVKHNRNEAIKYLIKLSDYKGYVTYDDIIDCVDKLYLPITEVDWLTKSLNVKNILIYEDDPSVANNEDGEYEDYAQSDYDELFKKVIRLDNSLEPFINEVKNIIPPQYGEMSQLKYLVKEGNEYARTRMIEMNLRLAIKIAYQNVETYDMDIVETIGSACMGLVAAVDKYDPNSNGPFSSYASLWIFQRITRDYSTRNPHIYFPHQKKNNYYSIYPNLKTEGCTKCYQIYECSDVIENISKELDYTYDESRELITSFIPFESFEVVIETYSDSLDSDEIHNCNNPIYKNLESFIHDVNIEEVVEYKCLTKVVDGLLDTLNEREKDILIKRYGLFGEKEKTLEEIGEIYSLTRERIRQIEAKALRKLRHPSRAKRLRGYEIL